MTIKKSKNINFVFCLYNIDSKDEARVGVILYVSTRISNVSQFLDHITYISGVYEIGIKLHFTTTVTSALALKINIFF